MPLMRLPVPPVRFFFTAPSAFVPESLPGVRTLGDIATESDEPYTVKQREQLKREAEED